MIKGLVFGVLCTASVFSYGQDSLNFFEADNKLIRYTGRIDFSNTKKPRFWQPGVYIQARFEGTRCEIILNDEVLWGKSQNYISIAVDGQEPKRQKTKGVDNKFIVDGLNPGSHTITICKSTEAGIGYVEFIGLNCARLLPVKKPKRKIEFIGNSITCGTGSDLSDQPCGQGEWYDQHNAYQSYGPTVARALNAQWHLTSVSGIGLMHSCCDMNVVMPDVFDKINMRDNKLPWDFSEYQPDVVTIMLGQNDGKQDSATFCNNYIRFIRTIRSKYPKTRIVCLTSPMADDVLRSVMKNYLTSIVERVTAAGDKRVTKFFYSRSWSSGCGGHPDITEHRLIAGELQKYLKTLMKW
jgi:lysophospholipase L1-like esterase